MNVGAGSNLTVTIGFTQNAGQTSIQGAISVNPTSGIVINDGTFLMEGNFGSSPKMTVNGASSKFIANTTQAVKRLTLDNGTAEIGLADNSSGSKVLTTTGLTLTSAGTVQLHHGGLMLDYTGASPITSIRAAIISGFHNGDWTGAGITSSAATALPSDRAVGYAEPADIGSPATFLGVAVPDATTVLVRMTIKGDSNLDGTVNFADLVGVAQNYGSATLNLPWSKGDFNYDGLVNFSDLVAVAQHYGNSLGSPASIPGAPVGFADDWASAQQNAVPEPATLSLLAALGLLLRRRR